MMARRALIVGINHYGKLGKTYTLKGAIADAQRVAEILSTHHNGDPNYDCITLLSDPSKPVTRGKLHQALRLLFRNTGDEILFYFSGHGAVTDLGGYIVTQDATTNDLGISMDELLILANDAHDNESVIVLDSCMSGTMGNSRLLQGDGPYGKSLLGKNVSILAASRENEESIEEAGQGLFTSLFLGALDGVAANILGNITLPAIYAHIEGALGPWGQAPIYKTYTAQVSVMRKAKPQIEIPLLRRLKDLFPEPDSQYQLSPEYEYDEIPVTDKQKIGQLFKRYRDAGLVCAVIEGQDFYWVAMHSGFLQLTQLGRHFWTLIRDRRF